MDQVKPIAAIVAIVESVDGLFGAADIGASVTMWCKGRRVLERHSDGAGGQWRPMTAEDVHRLLDIGAIAQDTADRQEIRVLR